MQKKKRKPKINNPQRRQPASAAALDKFEPLFRRGTELLHRGQMVKALPYLERANELEPAHFDAALNLSGAYILTKKFGRAVALLEPFQELHGDNEMLWTNLGAAYLGNPVLAKDDDQLRAIAAFKKALELNPIAPHVAYNLGLIYSDRHDPLAAIGWFRQAIQANPNDRDAHMLLAKLLEAETPASDS